MTDAYAQEIHRKHAYAPLRKNGLEVPETAVHLDDSPTGPNEPFKLYRTRGPWAEPEEGLPALRSEWTVSYAHADEVEAGMANALGSAETIVHVEPLGYTTRTGPLWSESLANPR